MADNWKRKVSEEKMKINCKNGVTYLTFPALEESRITEHAFSTRMGGASEGCFATMNFSFTRGDNPSHVLENYKRMAGILNTDYKKMVLSHQTHTTNIRVVNEEDCGKGITADRDYADVDGLITNVKGITLVTFYADCVPLYFLDTKNKAIGLSHSGWRGTVNKMGAETINCMAMEYGTCPEDIIACIGPSICGDCYEVGDEVREEFKEKFSEQEISEIFNMNGNGRFQLDLWKANQIVLKNAGVKPENIHLTDICTYCNSEYMFSHRKMGNERGNLAAFLCLKS